MFFWHHDVYFKLHKQQNRTLTRRQLLVCTIVFLIHCLTRLIRHFPSMVYTYKTPRKKDKYTTSGSNLTCLKQKLFLKNISSPWLNLITLKLLFQHVDIFCKYRSFFVREMLDLRHAYTTRTFHFKGYLRYKTTTSQNVPSKAQTKNFFIS